jgi:tetratricopeptide (TPR) repeat protein
MAGSFEDIGSIAWDSSIIIRDPQEKLQMENLQRWFALGVEYPWLEALIRLVIKVPHNKVTDSLYWWIHKLFKGYAITHRVHPIRLNLRTIVKQMIHFGVEMAERGLWREALYRWREALRHDPDNARLRNNIAVALESLGQMEEARVEYVRALELAPESNYIKKNKEGFEELFTSLV